ncbi:hypothetical protein Fleli_0925 [Bernardetia litoralis DSM 6794]|uniref:DUF445 family protein n=1 Tax=Bernardetia litoralis (strain ATCC 23117 / DSM 6794 / NBRC 15988 / NCIMB 1366 / Fx l1 / Sio-4) TaxID=880071 RepID=I4AHE4_BERLS|nr:DUF445 family protein [Bernardetia litoralis]AFM03379.1 hypothetical protein Fleli_0925 [Bernardetia litoralis DSM 6794]
MVGLTYAAKALTGAFVGYITNDLAIQMLFRKRFGLGGIFLKTHHEFVLNISKLVERDILNHKTLLPQVENEDFKKVLQKTVQTYIENKLANSVSQDFRLQDIPKFKEATNIIREQAKTNLPQTLEPFLLHLSKETTLGDAISEEQWQSVSKNIVSELMAGVSEWKSLEKLVRDFTDEIGNESISSFIHSDLAQNIKNELHFLTADLHLLLEAQHKKPIENLINQTFKELEIEELVANLAERISKKRLIDILGEDKAQHLVKEILQRLQAILETEEGVKIIDVFSDFLIKTLEKEEKTIFELLDANTKATLEKFFAHQFPAILVKVIGWLYSRQRELEILIDQTFTNNVESGFKNWLVKVFVGSISQSTDIIGRITGIIDSYRRNPKEVAKELTQQVVQYLESKSIGEIVSGLKTQNTVVSLTKILRKNVSDALSRMDVMPLANLLLEKEIGEFIPTEKLIPFLLANLNKFRKDSVQTLIFNPKFSERLTKELNKRVDKVLETPLNELIAAEQRKKLAINFEKWAVEKSQNHQAEIAEFLSKNISERVNEQPLSRLISADQIEELAIKLTERANSYTIELLNSVENEEVRNYLVGVKKFPNLSEDLSKTLHKFLIQNLDTLVEGRIEEIVQLNLSQQSPETIRTMVEKFMGKELKPITALGALWGGVAGGALAAMPQINQPILHYAVPAVAYGLTGLGTNWIALQMIFKPYEKKYFPLTGKTVAVPLTPGIVITNRERFANNMGNFVGDKLMSEEGLRTSFEQSKDKILAGAKNWIQSNDYAKIYEYTEDYKAFISQKGANFGWKLLKDFGQEKTSEKESKLSNLLKKGIQPYQKFTLEDIDTSSFENTVLKYIQDDSLSSLVSETAFEQIESYLKNYETLGDALPQSVRIVLYDKIKKWISLEMDSFFEKIDSDQQVDYLIKQLNSEFAEQATERTIQNYLSKKQTHNLETKLSDYLVQQLQNTKTQTKVFEFIDKHIAAEIAGEKKIGELFNGSLLNLLTNNIDFIIQKMIETGAEWLTSNSEEVANQVYEKAYSEQKTAFIYKKAIKKTAKELATEGIPKFLLKEIESVNRLVHNEVERIGEVSLGEVGIKLNNSYLEKTVSNLLSNKTTQNAVRDLTNKLLKTLFQTKVSTFISVTDIHSLEDLQNLLQTELKLAGKHLKTHYYSNKKQLQEKPNELIIGVIESILQKNSFENQENNLTSNTALWERIDKKALHQTIEKVSKQVLKSAALDTQGRRVVALLFERIKKIPANEFVDWTILEKDLAKAIQKQLDKPKNKELFEDALSHFIQKNLLPVLKKIPNESKDFVVELLLNAGLEALQEELPHILASIPIKEIVVSEISQMPPQEIEALFNSFAKKYFDRLVQYGFGFGIAFGFVLDNLLEFGLDYVE